MANEVIRNIRGAVGATNNVYSEGTINLALSLESAFLYYVTCVNVSLDSIAALDDSMTFQWQVCRQSKSAMAGLDDSDTIWNGGWSRLTTTSGASVVPLVECLHQLPPYAIAIPELHLGVLLTGGASDAVVTFNLTYYPRKVSQKQFWEASTAR